MLLNMIKQRVLIEKSLNKPKPSVSFVVDPRNCVDSSSRLLLLSKNFLAADAERSI